MKESSYRMAKTCVSSSLSDFLVQERAGLLERISDVVNSSGIEITIAIDNNVVRLDSVGNNEGRVPLLLTMELVVVVANLCLWWKWYWLRYG